MTPDPRPLSAEEDLLARLAVFGRLLEAEWYNGNVDEGAYLRLNADLTGLVAVYVRPTLDAERACQAGLVEAAQEACERLEPLFGQPAMPQGTRTAGRRPSTSR
jgi:hypothetical protein